jgi:hypothetical protein
LSTACARSGQDKAIGGVATSEISTNAGILFQGFHGRILVVIEVALGRDERASGTSRIAFTGLDPGRVAAHQEKLVPHFGLRTAYGALAMRY